MAKLTEYTEATRFDANDILIKDGTNGTKKIKADNAAVEFAGLVSSVNHRNVFRGKNLGTSVTAAQKTAISNGTFDDLFIGDYWVINSVRWTIADMDYWYNHGDTAFTNHHLVIVPASTLYTAAMNDTNTTAGGYTGSKMYTEGLAQAKTAFNNAFGDMVLSHREYLINAVTDGHASAGAWFDSTVDLMNEIMVYGCMIRAQANGPTMITTTTNSKQQLALYRLNTNALDRRESFWLRDVASATSFALVYRYSYAGSSNASSSSVGVRPVAAIG